MDSTDVLVERITFPGSGHTLDGCLAYQANSNPRWRCLIAGPHPLLGGNLDNNLTRVLANGFADAGAVAMTFDYGGVGESGGGPSDWPTAISGFWRDGSIPEEDGWREDAVGALAWLAKESPALPLVMVGYSFGCWVAACTAAENDPIGLVLISPNPARHDFSALSKTTVPLLVLSSDQELDVDADELQRFGDAIREPKFRKTIPAGEHFFRGRETLVLSETLEFLRRHGIGSRIVKGKHVD